MNHTLVVETVRGRTMDELRSARDRVSRADLVELRLDGVAQPDIAGALGGRTSPVIVTCRASWEGGQFEGSEDERLNLLAQAIRGGAEFVDVEWRADRRHLPRRDGTKIVLSHHDFAGVPADLRSRVEAMTAEGADVVKASVMAARLGDCLTLRDALPEGYPHIGIAMGAAGLVTRLCPWLFGSCWTYGGTAAPGQTPAADLIDLYRVRSGSRATALYAVIGAPIAHSASPAMHNPALVALGLDAVYVPLETANASDFFSFADAIGLAGASVTAPLKLAAYAHATSTDELSREAGAANTLRRHDGQWEARNFDAGGFLAPLDRRRMSLEGRRTVVLGAGGAARTVSWALRSRGAKVEVSARRTDRAAALARDLGVAVADWPPRAGWDLLVNTTPVGTWPATTASPIDHEHVRGRCVYDLIYNPSETALLAMARTAGADTIGGLEMLVAQACRQFEWWTGRPAPAATMERGARQFIARMTGQDHDADHI